MKLRTYYVYSDQVRSTYSTNSKVMSDQVFVLSSDSIDYYVIYNKDFSAVHAYSLSAPDSDLLVSICTYANLRNLPEKLRSQVSHRKVVEKEFIIKPE